ncbi:polyketide synthase dehydratase domain-containing protein, partial [Sphaerisporangium melleum]
AAFVELALQVGAEAGCGSLEELTIGAPLVVPVAGGVRLQVLLGGVDEDGRRPVTIHSQLEDAAGWTQHAQGMLIAASELEPIERMEQWPPAGAQPVSVDGLYEDLAQVGLGYGPVFQGVVAAWRAGGVVYAEVVLPEQGRVDVSRFGVHPALLDAALHGIGLGGLLP